MTFDLVSNRILQKGLTENYALSPSADCRLLRAYTNDVYLVTDCTEKYVLKIYGKNWRTESEIAYEIALLQHLAASGLRIAEPIAGQNGFLHRFETNEGTRYAVLFMYADGDKPQPPFTPELYTAFGRAIARMHTFSTSFVSEHSRPALDLDCILAAPVALIVSLLIEPADRTFLSRLAAALETRMEEFIAAGLEWGPIHGDATLDNLHVTAGGDLILYDFDSGGPGWRAADLQGWAMLDKMYSAAGDAFQAGYTDVRTFAPVNLLAAPCLTVLWDIWGLKIEWDNRLRHQPSEQAQAALARHIELIRNRCHQSDFFAG